VEHARAVVPVGEHALVGPAVPNHVVQPGRLQAGQRRPLGRGDVGLPDVGVGVEYVRVGGSDVDVEADADEVDAVDAFAEEAGEFFIVVDDVVGPFESDGMIAGEFGRGVAHGEAGDEGDLVGIFCAVDRKSEGDGEGAVFGPPGISATAAAGDLIGGEDDGGGEEIAALAEKGGVVARTWPSGSLLRIWVVALELVHERPPMFLKLTPPGGLMIVRSLEKFGSWLASRKLQENGSGASSGSSGGLT